MHYKKVMPVTLLIIALFLTVLFTAWLNPPVTISLKFDQHTQIISTSLTNESDMDLLFDGPPLVSRQAYEELARNVCVKIFSKDGKTLSKFYENRDGCINWRDDMSSEIRSIPLETMSLLTSHQTVNVETRLEDLLAVAPYSELLKLNDFCAQFKATFYFNAYLLFPVTKETEKFCLASVLKTKK